MACNDPKCLDRNNVHPKRCMNPLCNISGFKVKYPLHELIGKVIITKNCSADMVKKIQGRWSLNPRSFKIFGDWQRAKSCGGIYAARGI